MKKILILFFVAFLAGGAASAQTKKTKKKTETTETKVKRTTTIPQKVHNVIHPKHKKYSGHKIKHKVHAKKEE